MSEPLRLSVPPGRPALIYDGACGFCRLWVARWRQATGAAVEYLPWPSPEARARFHEIPEERFARSVQFIDGGGTVHEGAGAVFLALAERPGGSRGLALYRRSAAFAALSEKLYAFVAARRPLFSLLTRVFWGAHVQRPAYAGVRGVFLRGLALVYLLAFLSFWGQAQGLVGSRGILPLAETMQAVRAQAGAGWAEVPALFWLSDSDAALHGVCAAGTALALLALAGVAQAPALALLWFLYLSLCAAGGPFMSFQWDTLLLETGLVAVFFAPWRGAFSWKREAAGPSRAALWLLRWLLFRLMFQSGCVKLLSGDDTWSNLRALQFHYETQPLPNALSFFAHQLPAWAQTLSALGMFAVELGAPFLIFMPRRPRLAAFGMFVLLQGAIAATGNFAFFNMLTLVLCLTLLDDAALPAWAAPRRAIRGAEFPLKSWTLGIFAVLALAVGAGQTLAMFGAAPPRALRSLERGIAPFRSVNRYGLFAVMTTQRPEIIIEGSADGSEWKPYALKWKPGELSRMPGFAAPHQPRLDWQMWFAALGGWRRNQWALFFMMRLLENEPSVTALLADNPFPDTPPRYVRAVLYDYRFTDFATLRREGRWWNREPRGLWCPVLSREGFARGMDGNLAP